jgi:hypothetical protein
MASGAIEWSVMRIITRLESHDEQQKYEGVGEADETSGVNGSVRGNTAFIKALKV